MILLIPALNKGLGGNEITKKIKAPNRPIILIRKNQVAKHHFNDSNFTIINHENLIEQVDMYKIVDFNLPKKKNKKRLLIF